jgi:vanadium chloroperoxidase
MPDYILIWNEVALEANRVSHTDRSKAQQNGPTLSSRALAIVHLAMYDAYAGVANDPTNLPAYLTPGPAPADATIQAAVSAAAYTTLVCLYSEQKDFFKDKLENYGDPVNPGHEFGVKVAEAILTDRQGEENHADPTGYQAKLDRGKHRPDPDNPDQGYHAPFYGSKTKGFAITKRHELDAPPFGNNEYLKALKQVRAKGIAPELMGTLPPDLFNERRTPEETVIGIYWAYDGAIGLGTPPRLYNQIVRTVAIARNNSEADNARLFAFVNAAMGDAGILAWDQKYIHELWRPVVGIREHDRSFGPAELEADDDISTDVDPYWLPLGAPKSNILNKKFFPVAPENPPTNRALLSTDDEAVLAMDEDPRRGCAECITLNKNFTPNFPAYPSGHATFGAAALHITRLFYGVTDKKSDDLFDGLSFVSEELNGGSTELDPNGKEILSGTQDNKGTVRPTHRREFYGGLWQMIVENGLSRVYLGVHWLFDAFQLKSNGQPALSKNIGGVPLGLKIAEDIFNSGEKKAPKKSTVVPRTP